MLKACRKYGSVILLTLMSMVTLCVVVDELGDSQQLVKQAKNTMVFASLVDDIDIDEVDDDDWYICRQITEVNAYTTIWAIETNKGKTQEVNRPLVLQHEQMNHYSPRSSIADSPNYTHLSIARSGMDLLHATFFVQT